MHVLDRIDLHGLGLALDPCDAPADIPLVLLPVRLETRFSPDGASLMVRMYPDDVHVSQVEPGLSDTERAAGLRYWNSIWSGGPAAEAAAWQVLLAETSSTRAAWVAYRLTPTNLAQRPVGVAADGDPAPDFPTPPAATGQPPVRAACWIGLWSSPRKATPPAPPRTIRSQPSWWLVTRAITIQPVSCATTG